MFFAIRDFKIAYDLLKDPPNIYRKFHYNRFSRLVRVLWIFLISNEDFFNKKLYIPDVPITWIIKTKLPWQWKHQTLFIYVWQTQKWTPKPFNVYIPYEPNSVSFHVIFNFFINKQTNYFKKTFLRHIYVILLNTKMCCKNRV